MFIGLIGVGRLGMALVKGFINGGIKPERIYAYDVSAEALDRVKSLGVTVCNRVEEVATYSDVIIVAVKPQDVLGVVEGISHRLSEDKALVSTAAFVPLKAIEKRVSKGRVYRAMPNVAVEVNRGFTALTPLERRSSEIENLFKVLGRALWVKEEVLDLLTIISASTPAIVAEIYDSFVLAALKAGVPYDVARKAVASVFQGVGELLETKDVSSVRDSVITPRGTTIILVERLYTYEVKSRLVKALTDSIEEYLDKLVKYKKDFE